MTCLLGSQQWPAHSGESGEYPAAAVRLPRAETGERNDDHIVTFQAQVILFLFVFLVRARDIVVILLIGFGCDLVF